MNTTETTIHWLRDVLANASIKSSRGRLDLFTDRLARCAAEPTLAAAAEQLTRAMQCELDRMHPPLSAAMIRIAASQEGPRVLRWWREQSKLVAMLVATRDDALLREVLAEVALPELTSATAAAVPRPQARITLDVTTHAPLSHGAEGKAGNATLFRRINVLASDGSVLHLPYYAGNAVRGQIRDLLADHLLESIGLTPDRGKPPVALWFFYALYSGGALEEQSAATKALGKELGNHGAIRSEGIRTFRQMLPGLSLLGCALGNRVLPGRVQFGDLRPRCREWGTGDSPVADLMAWEYLTRREDHEDHADHHGMIASTEVLRAGVSLEGGVDHDDAATPQELGALAVGLDLLAKRGYLGAQNRAGLGKVALVVSGAPDPQPYLAHLTERKDEILDYLAKVQAIGGLL